MSQRLEHTLHYQNLPLIDYKEYRSTEFVSTKENKAKKNLLELAVEEDQRATARTRLGGNRKARVLCVNPWTNMNIEDSVQFRKISVDQYGMMGVGRFGSREREMEKMKDRERNGKENNSIEHLKSLLFKLDSPRRKPQSSARKRSSFYVIETQKPTTNNFNSARVHLDDISKSKDMWSMREAQLRLLFEPVSAFNSKPQTTKTKIRHASTLSSRRNLAFLENRSPLVKKKKVCPAKILNFHAKVPERVNGKRRFSLFELLE